MSHRKPLILEEEKQATVDVGIPEAIAEMNAQALSLFDQGDSDWITEDVLSLLGRRRAPSNSSPRATPRRSPQQRVGEAALGVHVDAWRRDPLAEKVGHAWGRVLPQRLASKHVWMVEIGR